MKKKYTLITLVLALMMLFGTMTTAMAAYCMNCGTQLPDAANYCFNCGAKQGASASSGSSSAATTTTTYNGVGIEITNITDNQNGTVSVRWSDSQNGAPYGVYNVQMRTDDFEADLENSTGFWTCAEDITSRSAVIDDLVPGQDYWIVVANADGNYVYEPYYSGGMRRFNEFTTDIEIQLKYRRDNRYAEVSSFSASDIARNSATTTYGAYIRLNYPRLARARSYSYMVAITAPNGEVIVDGSGQMELSSGNSYTYWNYYSLDWYFGILSEYFGSVPVGTYTWTLYYDGMYVSARTFRITN